MQVEAFVFPTTLEDKGVFLHAGPYPYMLFSSFLRLARSSSILFIHRVTAGMICG